MLPYPFLIFRSLEATNKEGGNGFTFPPQVNAICQSDRQLLSKEYRTMKTIIAIRMVRMTFGIETGDLPAILPV